MRLLLDSHVALWWLAGDSALGPHATLAITEADEVLYSAVTPWELGIKRALGKLHYPDGFTSELRSAGFVELQITGEHALVAAALPDHHRDPFDRMLVAQAQVDALEVVSADRALEAYDISIVHARA